MTASPALPDRLGIYRIESLLGRGGMGEVYLAWDEVLRRHVAIKRVMGEFLGDEVRRRRFLREARAVARIDHPAIVRMHHVLEPEGDPCLVMEFVQGRDLSKVPVAELPVARVVHLALGVAEGLAAAHGEGLVHRDLKPANIMATPDGGVKILDFGLAVVRASEEEVAGADREVDDDADELTGSGMLVGTVQSMSPEQATGGPVDARSDLFSFGTVLYELLTGVSPFEGRSMMDTLRRVVSVPPAPVETLAPSLPPELARLVGELLEKDRDLRPRSARAVAERLRRIARSLPEAARRVGPADGADGADGSDGAAVDPDMPTAEVAAFSESPADEASDGRPTVTAAIQRVVEPSSGLVLRTVAHVEWSPRAVAGGAEEAGAERLGLLTRLASRYDGLPYARPEEAGASAVYLFFRPADAAAFCLELHEELADLDLGPARAGVHLGEISLEDADGDEALAAAARLARCARPGQTLVGRSAFDLARGARAPSRLAEPDVRWLAHGSYLVARDDEPFEVFEVGRDGRAPLRPPVEDGGVRRAGGLSQELALGWRPATGQPVPRRAGWKLVERLGEGGFGEVWLARRGDEDGERAAGEERVFKFCFEPERLRALKREVALFRLLRETLGHRDDIARVLDWDFEEVPYFLESEYTDGGDLERWSARHGGPGSVPLDIRLELVAQVADALAAAHSVGILHKDVKPANVLVGHDDDGRPRARLTDFGIGLLTDRSRLGEPGFTALGFTSLGFTGSATGDSSSQAGTVQYMAPELLDGKPATTRADVFSLGVVLYQCVVGDFGRSLAQGWRRDVDDPLLADDIAACVDGSPEERLQDPGELAERLRTLAARREARRAEEEAAAAEARSRRRRRVAGWLGVAAAVLLLVVSVFAYQTDRAREQAEQRRRQAENLLDFLLGDLRAELQPIGKLAVLDRVGDEAMEYFAAVPESQLSAEELANYSKALHQIGQVRFALGKPPEAAEAFRESLEMAARLAASDPDDADRAFQLGQSHFWLGYMRWEERDLDAAAEQFDAYRRISESLVDRDPENDDWRLELAYSWSNLGQVREEQGRLEEATRALETSRDVFASILAARPDDLDLAVETAHVEAKLGQVLRSRGELPRALERFAAALGTYRRAAEARPDVVTDRVHVGTMRGHMAATHLEKGAFEAALPHAEASLQIARDLVSHDAGNIIWRETLAARQSLTARVLLTLGRTADAKSLLVEEESEVDSLAEREGGHSRWQVAQARNRCVWADVLLQETDFRGSLEKALACRDMLLPLAAQGSAREVDTWLKEARLLVGRPRDGLGGEEPGTARAE